jgi:hypothetical protein
MKNDASLSNNTIPAPPLFELLPSEVTVNILTYLRAYDLSALHQTCRYFASPSLVHTVIKHQAEHVYPPELTDGYEIEGTDKYGFESLRNMEWLVVARVLSRPEPAAEGFYVSKSWCKTALKWLELQQEQQRNAVISQKNNCKKMSKKKIRQRNRRLSDASPPWPNVNSDIVCCHDNLQHCSSGKAARARRRLLDKKAWKVLKKLYPESVSLDSCIGECLHCRVEVEAQKLEAKKLEEQAKEERRKPLGCSVVRGIYTRTRGVPTQALSNDEITCPLKPGIYHVLPRSWLYQWRRYLKSGEGEKPMFPDASTLLCHGHRLPLIPPHLEAYLFGETGQLLTCLEAASSPPVAVSPSSGGLPVGMSPVDAESWNAMRAAGISQQELNAQRSLSQLQPQQRIMPHPVSPPARSNKELLDMENGVVVEILTDQEFTELVKWWPDSNCFSLRFSVLDGSNEIEWSTLPCRDCDASGKNYALSVRNRTRSSRSNGTFGRRASSTALVEY